MFVQIRLSWAGDQLSLSVAAPMQSMFKLDITFVYICSYILKQNFSSCVCKKAAGVHNKMNCTPSLTVPCSDL